MKININLEINQEKLAAVIDTGSDVTCIGENFYNDSMPLEKSELQAGGLCNDPVTILGKTHGNFQFKNKTFSFSA